MRPHPLVTPHHPHPRHHRPPLPSPPPPPALATPSPRLPRDFLSITQVENKRIREFGKNIGGWQIGNSNRKDDSSEDMLFNDKELVHFRSAYLEEALAL